MSFLDQISDAREYLETILEASHDGILVVDEQGRFEYGNPAFYRTFGWPHDEIVGAFFMKVVPPDLHDFMRERWAEVQRGEGRPYETEIVHKDGSRRALLVSHRHMTVGGVRKYAVVTKDVTERKHVERQLESHRNRLEEMVVERTRELTESNKRLAASEAALARAQASTSVGSWEWDFESGEGSWSDELYRLHGFEKHEGTPPFEVMVRLIHSDDRDRFEEARQRVLNGRGPAEIDYRIVRNDGATLDVVCGMKLVEGRGCAVISGTVQNVTERRRIEREVVRVAQHEKEQIGRVIHDSLGQELVALALKAQALQTMMDTDAHELRDQAGRLSELASKCVAQARQIAHGLSPVDLADGELASELRRIAERTNSLHGIQCHCLADGGTTVHNRDVAVELFYIAQEAVANAAKHAQCSRIELELHCDKVGRVTVRDNGTWDEDSPSDGGTGLRIMRNRANLIGARLDIEHPSAGGTCITCTFPNDGPTPGARTRLRAR